MARALRTQLKQGMALVKSTYLGPDHTTTIYQNGMVQGVDDPTSMFSVLKERARSIASLKKTALWTVVKETFRDAAMWKHGDRIRGPLTMPKNRKGSGGGKDVYAYTSRRGRVRGPKNVLNIDVRRQGIRIYSTRPYPPVPNDSMSMFIAGIMALWIMRGS